MKETELVLGIDLGTSGVRIALIDKNNNLIYSSSVKYLDSLENCKDWEISCKHLIKKIPNKLKEKLTACSVDGTSGTLMACTDNGAPLGNAIPYYIFSQETKKLLIKTFPKEKNVINCNSSIARAMQLINLYGDNILLRHQADWLTGWLLNNWEFGEEGNNIRLGWNLLTKSWISVIDTFSWQRNLPQVLTSGSCFGLISKALAIELDLPENLKIIAGTTDSNAAVLATNPKSDEGITVLGSTIVIKSFVQKPIESPGITNHLVNGKWISGGASNAGGSVLKKFFSEKALKELSRQINPEIDSGLNLLPLPSPGERFPINDSNLKPILNPRPTSDALYLHGLLEGLARIEARGWEKLVNLGAQKPKKIITIGGGAKNPQWRRIRERIIGIPIGTSNKAPAEGVARIAMDAIAKKSYGISNFP